MCLWNMDAPVGNKVKIWQNNLVPHFDQSNPKGGGGACDVSCVWETFRWTYSPHFVTVSASIF